MEAKHAIRKVWLPLAKPPTRLNNAYVQLLDQLTSSSHKISRGVTQANEITGYMTTSGPPWRSWLVVSGWIMMTVIRKDPEKPIDLQSIAGGKEVTLMSRLETLMEASAAPVGGL